MRGLFLWTLLVASISFGSSLLFVLDVSGSMKGKIDGKTKLEVAKDVLIDVQRELPADLRVGLMAYGHYGEKDCSAIELLVPPGTDNRDDIAKKLSALKADKGATPIAGSLRKAGEILRKESGRKALVLVTDGVETCGGDPVKVAEGLRKSISDIKVHVVGFGVGGKEESELIKISEAGGGSYYAAKDAKQLAQSLKNIKREEVGRVIFSDDFDGDSLKKDWEVVSPNPDNMIVEDGYLQIVTETFKKGDFTGPVNLLLLKEKLPKQYEVNMKVTHVAPADPYLGAGIVLYKDDNNQIILFVSGDWGNWGDWKGVRFRKKEKGKWGTPVDFKYITKSEKLVVTLKLQRIKRKFIAWFRVEEVGEGETEVKTGRWYKVGEIPQLRANYRLGIFVFKNSEKDPDALMQIDSLEVREIR